MKRCIPGVLVVLVCLASARATDGEHGFLAKTFRNDSGESKYIVFIPHDYSADKEYPLILFLHGAGERGDDGEAPVKQGIGNAIKFKGKDKTFPFIVVFPQCAKGGNNGPWPSSRRCKRRTRWTANVCI